MAKRIVFLGSYMHCIFGIGEEIPKTGETVNGSQYIVDYSGKGRLASNAGDENGQRCMLHWPSGK